MTTSASDIHLLFCLNDAYLTGALVVMGSTLDFSNPKNHYVVHVFDTGISEKGKSALNAFFAERQHVALEIHEVDLSCFRGANLLRGNLSAYARILAGRYIHASKVLYIDADFLVLRDVSVLFSQDMGQNILLAVRDSGIRCLGDDPARGLSCQEAQEPYFNTGFILWNLDAWREKGCEQAALELIRAEGPHLRYYDQTALNTLLIGRIGELPEIWNIAKSYPDFTDSGCYHFGGPVKPWHRPDTSPARLLWSLYYRKRVKHFWTYGIPFAQKCKNSLLGLRDALCRHSLWAVSATASLYRVLGRPLGSRIVSTLRESYRFHHGRDLRAYQCLYQDVEISLRDIV